MDRPLPLTWLGPVFDPSGYADEGRGFLCALEREGVRVALRPLRRHVPGFREGLPEAERRILARQIDRPIAERPILVQHHTADGFARTTDATLHIGRTMFETDSIPPFWVHCCNRMDELWLPSQFNLDTFRRAGVTAPVVIVPGGIDTDSYRPDRPALSLPGLRGTVFLSVFEWRLGKGWDVLLRAWAEAFAPTDDVTLVLRTYPLGRVAGQDNAAVINARIDDFLREACGLARSDVAPIRVLGEAIPAEQMPALYRIASALVAPTRGEGWGRPFMEAMATGVPVIATNWSAHLEFMHTENSLLLDIDGLEPADGSEVSNYGAQRWAAPSVSHLVTRLRQVHADPGATAALGQRAREEMRADWPWQRAARVIAERLTELHARRPEAAPAPRAALVGDAPTLRLDGPFFTPHPMDGDPDRVAGAIAHHWPAALRIRPQETSIIERPAVGAPALAAWHALSATDQHEDRSRAAGTADVVITWLDPHAAPPPRPSTGWWIVHTGNAVGTSVPGPFVRTLRDLADEVWVPNRLAERACRAIGLPAAALWHCPLPAPLPDAPPDGPRFPTAADRAPSVPTATDPAQRRGPVERVFVLPIRSPDDLEPADALLRAWPHTVPSDARLLVHAAPTDDEQIIAWIRRMARDLASGRHQLGASIELATDLLRDEELAALARTADVLLLPVATPGTQRLAALAEVYGRPVVRGVSGVSHPASPRYTIARASGAPFPLAEWRAVIRSLATDTRNPTRMHGTAIRPDHHRAVATLASPSGAALDAWGSAATRRLLDEQARHAWRAARLGTDSAHAVPPFVLHEARATTLLAMPDWHDGSGGGLVRAYGHACHADDECSLVLCLDPAQGVAIDDVVRIVHEALAAAGHDAESGPDIVLVSDALDDAVRASLIRRCDAVVALNDPRAAEVARAMEKPTLSRLATASWRALLTRVPVVA